MPENKKIPVIFLAPANKGRSDSVEALESELESIASILQPMEEKRACTIIREREEDNVYFVDMATQIAYKDRVEIIHIAGGRPGKRYLRMDSASGEVAMDLDEFTDLLAEFPRLTLVFITGCANPRLTRKILTKTRAAVIRIERDPRNKEVVREFYSNLAKGSIIKRSFGQATINCGDHLMYELMTLPELTAPPFQRKDIFEGLYARNDYREQLDWKLSPSFYILVDQNQTDGVHYDYALEDERPARISPWLKPIMAGITSLMGVGLLLFSLFSQVPNRLVDQLASNTICPFPGESNAYNILILPFFPDEECGREENDYKVAVKDAVDQLKVVMDMPVNVQYHNALCPTTDFFASGVGGTCNANLVVWGTYSIEDEDDQGLSYRFSTINRYGENELIREMGAPWKINNGDAEALENDVRARMRTVIQWSRAMRLYQSGQYEKAAERFEMLANTQKETYVSIEQMIARARTEMGNYDLAILHYNKALSVKPDNPSLLIEKSNLNIELEAYDVALEDINKALQLNPDYADAYIILGILYRSLNHQDTALQEFNKAIVIAPDHAEAYLMRGGQFTLMGRADAAMADFQRSIEKDPRSSEPYKAIGKLHEKLSNYPEAIDDYLKATEINPQDSEAWFKLGVLNMRYSKYEKALLCLADAIELNPQKSEYYSHRALVYTHLKVDSLAINDANTAVRLAPEDCYSYAVRGQVLVDDSEYASASEDFERALNIDPECEDAYYGLGLLHEELGNEDKAIDNFTKAIDYSDYKAFAYCKRGSIYEAEGKRDQAMEDYNAAIELDPNLSQAYNFRADLYVRMGNLDKALADYNTAIQKDNGMPAPYYNRGFFNMMQGNYDEAVKDVNRSIEFSKKGTALHFQLLARIYALQRKDSLFYVYLKKSLEEDIPLFEFQTNPDYESYQSKPEFMEIISKYEDDTQKETN